MVAGREWELSPSLWLKFVAARLAGGSDPEMATAGRPDCYRRKRSDKRKD